MYLGHDPHQIPSSLYNSMDVPGCHDHCTEWYHWPQSVEAKHPFNDPKALALGYVAHSPTLTEHNGHNGA
jgi:hypothetical protein